MKLIILLLLTPSFVFASTFVRIEPFVESGAVQNFEHESTCQEGGFTCQEIEDTSIIRANLSGAKPILEIDPDKLASQKAEQNAAAQAQEAKKVRQAEIQTLAQKSGNLTAAEIQRLLKSLAQEAEAK